jgi:ArsR family transcriptional regulator
LTISKYIDIINLLKAKGVIMITVDEKDTAIMNTYGRTFKALSSPSRLKIIKLLSQQEELCVCHIQSALKRGQGLVSYHLAVLEEAGLVTHREDGTWSYYKLVEDNLVNLLSAKLYTSLVK